MLIALTNVGLKILGAIAFWVIGRWLIGLTLNIIRLGLERQKLDQTILRYIGLVINITLNVLLVIGILGYFGIQTTSFAALIAPAGVAYWCCMGRSTFKLCCRCLCNYFTSLQFWVIQSKTLTTHPIVVSN